MIEQYGESDIGILFTFFFNILNLNKGQAFVISPDEPHAYISGDLVEAMVSSDNVVRGGLTPKFKDTQTLVEMLIYEFKERSASSGTSDTKGITKYETGYEEFMIEHIVPQNGESITQTYNSLAIAIVLEGEANCSFGDEKVVMENKTAYYIMPEIAITISGDASIFICRCDI